MGLLSRIKALEAKLNEVCTVLFEDSGCDDSVEIVRICESYNNPLATGYDNWNDPDDLESLADEFGITITGTPQIWVRALEAKCDGVSLPIEGKVYGPYSPTGGVTQFFSDLAADTANQCIQISETTTGAINGSNTLQISTCAQDCTLVFQEGVNNIDWFNSVFGFVSIGGVTYDFLDNSYNGPLDGQPIDSFGQFVEGENCRDV